MMPRRRQGNTTTLPPRKIKLPVAAIFNKKLSDPAFRLLAVVTAYSWEFGYCDLTNKQLGDVLGVSRQFVSRLLGECYGLLVEQTLQGRRLLRPVDGTIGDADSPSRTPHDITGAGVLSTQDNIKKDMLFSVDENGTLLSTQDNINGLHVEEEERVLIDSSSSERGVLSTQDNIKQDMLLSVDNNGIDAAFGRIAARWVHYFGDIGPAVGDLLGDFLDDPDLASLAREAEEPPEAWLMAAIEETGLAEARNPAKYFRKVLSDWIKRGYRTPPQGDSHAANGSDNQNEPASLDGRAAIEAILDRFESGELGPDAARRQLAAYGVVL